MIRVGRSPRLRVWLGAVSVTVVVVVVCGEMVLFTVWSAVIAICHYFSVKKSCCYSSCLLD
jgi:hypothetical protein